MPTTTDQPTPAAPAVPVLPVHPRRPGWRAGAAAALLEQSVAELRSGRSPRATVEQLLVLGAHDRPAGLAAAAEVDRRLALTAPAEKDPVDVTEALFARLDDAAVDGCPHPGEWVASSVDVVPCAVHGYEAGPVDCLRRSVRAHLSGSGTLAEAVRTAPDGPVVGADPVRAALWVGVAAVAALREHAACR